MLFNSPSRRCSLCVCPAARCHRWVAWAEDWDTRMAAHSDNYCCRDSQCWARVARWQESPVEAPVCPQLTDALELQRSNARWEGEGWTQARIEEGGARVEGGNELAKGGVGAEKGNGEGGEGGGRGGGEVDAGEGKRRISLCEAEIAEHFKFSNLRVRLSGLAASLGCGAGSSDSGAGAPKLQPCMVPTVHSSSNNSSSRLCVGNVSMSLLQWQLTRRLGVPYGYIERSTRTCRSKLPAHLPAQWPQLAAPSDPNSGIFRAVNNAAKKVNWRKTNKRVWRTKSTCSISYSICCAFNTCLSPVFRFVEHFAEYLMKYK